MLVTIVIFRLLQPIFSKIRKADKEARLMSQFFGGVNDFGDLLSHI
jgi:hypothetical protein